MSTPFFTVVIPTRNRAELLRQAIRSVLTQTFQDFEVIIVDDHSTDHSNAVVSSFHSTRITYVLNDRTRGGAGARNAGIYRARGDWVAFLDDDDVWLPRKLELQYRKIKEVDDSVGLVYCGRATYDFSENREILLRTPQKQGWIQKDLLYKNYIGTLSGVAIRTEILKKVGGLDERFEALQDLELFIRIAAVSKVTFVSKKLIYTRVSNKDRITLDPNKKLRGNLLFKDKYEDLINQYPHIRHRAASRIFVFATVTGCIPEICKSLPWTLAGIIYDQSNFLWTFWTTFSNLFNNYRRQ